MSSAVRLGAIDLGGTQARLAVAMPDGSTGEVRRAVTAELNGPAGFVSWARGAFESMMGEVTLTAVGIAAPGPLDPRRGVLVNPPNLPGWTSDLPLADMLQEALGVPVRMENDANLAAVGEHRRGAGVGAANLVYITWSTGIGSGLILEGRLYSGGHGTAGEIGHMILDPLGPPCLCGQRGCLEVYAGGNALEVATGRPARDIFTLALNGDGEALGVAEQAVARFGDAVVNTINMLDPEVVVIGGGVTRSWAWIAPRLEAAIEGSPFIRPSRRPRLCRAALGDEAGLAGALEWIRDQVSG